MRRGEWIVQFMMARPVVALAKHGQDTPASGDDIARYRAGVDW